MEIWKIVIINNEIYDNYMVSNLGRVKSLNYNHTRKEKIMKISVDKYGYNYVKLCKNSKQNKFKIHRLVAQTFIPNPDNKPCVDHINTIRTDNRVENLRWVTISENGLNEITRKRISDIHKNKKQSEETKKKLSELQNKNKKQVLCIETGIKYNSLREAEKITGIPHNNISACCRGKGKYKTAGGYHWEFIN